MLQVHTTCSNIQFRSELTRKYFERRLRMFLKLSQCEEPSHCQSKSSFQNPSEKYTDNTKADKFVKSRFVWIE